MTDNDTTTEEILAQAEDLGHLIRNTDIYAEFNRTSELLFSDPRSRGLFDEFISFSSEIKQRQDGGDIIEKFEMERLRELTEQAAGNDIIVDFLNAQNAYLDLLLKIQKEINSDEV